MLWQGHIGRFKRSWLVCKFLLFVEFVFVHVEALHDLIHVATIGSLEQHVNVDRKLDSISRWPRSEVVLASLESCSPGVEMHCRHLTELRVFLIEVQALRLADERASCDSEVHHLFLTDLPNCLVNFFYVVWNLCYSLNTAVVCNDLVLDRGCP